MCQETADGSPLPAAIPPGGAPRKTGPGDRIAAPLLTGQRKRALVVGLFALEVARATPNVAATLNQNISLGGSCQLFQAEQNGTFSAARKFALQLTL